jgi:hypothetical protein
MGELHEGLERFERQLARLLSQVGTVDPASAGFRALMEDCERCTAALARAPAAERERERAQLVRLAGLNALVRDAVRSEQAGVAELLAQTRLVREALARRDQPGATGDSCDVRG